MDFRRAISRLARAALQARHHKVGDDQVPCSPLHLISRGGAVVGSPNAVPLVLKCRGQELDDDRVVVHDEHLTPRDARVQLVPTPGRADAGASGDLVIPCSSTGPTIPSPA